MVGTAIYWFLTLLLLALGTVQVWDPIRATRVQNRLFRLTMGRNVWFQLSERPLESRRGRRDYRIAGIGFLALGASMVWNYFRRRPQVHKGGPEIPGGIVAPAFPAMSADPMPGLAIAVMTLLMCLGLTLMLIPEKAMRISGFAQWVERLPPLWVVRVMGALWALASLSALLPSLRVMLP